MHPTDKAARVGMVMKAIRYHRYGSPDVLELEEVEKPTPADDQVLIKICATSVNPFDWHFMRAEPYIGRIMIGLGLTLLALKFIVARWRNWPGYIARAEQPISKSTLSLTSLLTLLCQNCLRMSTESNSSPMKVDAAGPVKMRGISAVY